MASVSNHFNGVGAINGHRRHAERAGVDVPCVVVFGDVLEKLELIAAFIRLNRIKSRILLFETDNTSVLAVYLYDQVIVLQAITVARSLSMNRRIHPGSWGDGCHFRRSWRMIDRVPQSRDIACFEFNLSDACIRVE